MTDSATIGRGHVEWGDGPQSAQIDDADGLARLLDRIDTEARAADEQVLAVVYIGPERFFSIGLGADETFVCFDDQTVWEGYYSYGELYDDDSDVGFWFGNQPTYAPRWALIPLTTAKQAVLDGFTSGQRPANISWK